MSRPQLSRFLFVLGHAAIKTLEYSEQLAGIVKRVRSTASELTEAISRRSGELPMARPGVVVCRCCDGSHRYCCAT